MTQRLAPTSSRFAAAVMFGELLSRRMTELEVGQNVVRTAARVSRASVVEFRNGRNLPTLEVALRIAEALNEPRLADIVRRARTFACQRCGRAAINEKGFPKRYCSAACRTLGAPGPAKRRLDDDRAMMILRGELLRVGQARKQQIGRALTLLDEARAPEGKALAVVAGYQEATDAMCRSCEPEGLCRTAECPLRTVSPLPLVANDVDVAAARRPPGRWGTPALRQAQSEAMRAQWAGDDERRRRVSEQQRARFATPEQRAEHGRRVSEARRRGIAARSIA